MTRRLRQLVVHTREALGLWCLGLPTVPRPISGGFNLIEIPLKKSAIGGTSVTLITDLTLGEAHPIGFGISASGLVFNTPSTPPAAFWGTAVSDGRKYRVRIEQIS